MSNSFQSPNPQPGTRSRVVQSGRHKIHFTEAGTGPAVLMLHGGGPGASGLSNYSRNLDAMARQFRVLVPDLPGYGRSGKNAPGDDLFGDLAASMIALLDALDIRRVHVVGNSLGGGCALRMALDHPARVMRMVLMGPGGVGISQGAPSDGLQHLLGYYAGEGPTFDKLRRFVCEDLVYDAGSVDESLLRERFEASINPEVVANPPLRPPKDPAAFRRLDFLLDPRLAGLHHPTLVLWGTEDRVNAPSGALALQQHMPACDVFLFSQTGHWVQWERATQFNATVLAFLDADGRERSGR